MPLPLHVLLLEHDPAQAEQMVHAVRDSGFEPNGRRVESEADYVAALDPPPALILANYTLPEFDTPRALKVLQERGLDVLFIVVSGPIGEERAVAAIRAGAQDFVPKERLQQLGQRHLSAEFRSDPLSRFAALEHVPPAGAGAACPSAPAQPRLGCSSSPCSTRAISRASSFSCSNHWQRWAGLPCTA